ncbi:uncharacterized protein LOC107801262 [Nicotiana tabacum]|uniref:Uncharacterized protein LOC107801262 n=2 Tax=Nicotiana TaxID=4085 RepID=A0A1S4AU65_TOBAC|nr:PREDICTED: uncharacterized protein LOC104218342 [Nicotiana sylvestris]XP_016480038.1 PREDICTED: uncharacterized protein LOC107801262 [Nicotiana tabacum]
MAYLKVVSTMSNCISTRLIIVPGNVWICRDFVSATRPSEKIDKETCQKIIEAAEAVKEGAKEVKSVGEFVKETVSSSAGNVISEMAKKTLEKATEQEEKGAWDKVKDTANDIKKKVVGK